MADVYGMPGLEVYEAAHYSRGEHVEEVGALVTASGGCGKRVLDLGCSAGLHALEFARRGYRVTGVDVEPSAIERARGRNPEAGERARFEVLDLVRDELAPLGVFDLIYSIGNVLSHVPKARLGGVLERVGRVLDRRGVFVFDLMSLDPRLPPESREPGTKILWRRTIDFATGRIELLGYFPGTAEPHRFRVWGYGEEEVVLLLKQAGFGAVESSATLRFDESADRAGPAACTRFRARQLSGNLLDFLPGAGAKRGEGSR